MSNSVSTPRHRFTERTWWLLILAAWFFVFALPTTYNQIGRLLPGTFWFELHDIHVTDLETADGRRIINYNRTIHREFPGRWQTSEEVLISRGFASLRRCSGEATYRPDKTPPDPTTLHWLTGKVSEEERQQGVFDNCRWEAPYNTTRVLPDGLYRVCVTVKVKTPWGEKPVDECSNVYRDPLDTKILVE